MAEGGNFYKDNHKHRGRVLFLCSDLNLEKKYKEYLEKEYKEYHRIIKEKFGFEEIIEEGFFEGNANPGLDGGQLPQELTMNKMKHLLKKAAGMDYSDYDYFMCVIVTHGDNISGKYRVIEGMDCFYDEEVNKLLNLFDPDFGCHASLHGKPKIFLISACAGNITQEGRDLHLSSTGEQMMEGIQHVIPGRRMQLSSNRARSTSEGSGEDGPHTQAGAIPEASFPDDCCVVYSCPIGYATHDRITKRVVEELETYDVEIAESLLNVFTTAMRKMSHKNEEELQLLETGMIEHSLAKDIRFIKK